MAYRDLRAWINKLESENELLRIKAEVDWNIELGGIARKALDEQAPALLFENIKDYRDGRCKKLFTGGIGTRKRLAMALGFQKDTHFREMVEFLRRSFKEQLKPIILDRGPVKENIIKGNDVNFYEFPVPKWHHWDGGRFPQTSVGVVTKDPDTGWVNIGTYRGMLVDKNRLSQALSSRQHWGMHFTKYRDKGKSMPVAVFLGWDPVYFIVGAAGAPYGICEYDIMGAIRKEPVPLVKCETIDLYVPATAEIVYEGYISPDPDTYEYDGPFGEYTGYYAGEREKRPVLKVKCIMHRNDPIFQGTLECWGPGHLNESSCMLQISATAIAWNLLESSGVPGVLDVYLLPASAANTFAVKIKKTYLGQVKQVAMALWAGLPYWLGKNVIVVDDDIDIYDFEAIEWAIAYRFNPGEGDLTVVEGTPGSPIDPAVPIEDRNFKRFGAGIWNRMLIDATKNWKYTPQEQYGGDIYPPVGFTIDKETRALIDKKWKEYGFK
jgi:4-hydroxy-3-polyprenylbenzoate decarboxylase